MGQYLALLRGINVGGNNLIRMPALAAAFEAEGMTSVATYIQSGNVIFESRERSPARLVMQLEEALGAAFSYSASLVVVSRRQMEDIVARAPDGFGTQPERFLYSVLYLKPTLTADDVITSVPLKEGVDQAFGGPGVVYFSRLASRATSSRLSRIASLPLYKELTVRNWNTTIRLLELMRQG